MKKFIPFNMYPLRLVLNTCLIIAIAAVMTLWGSDIKGLCVAGALLFVSIIINGKDIFLGCRDVLASMRRKKSTTVE
jgi:hypothetical protein